MRIAFKEWAVVCRALATGRQTVILRKGGIVEEGGAFRPDHPEFLLFPTYSHQSPEDVLPEARMSLDDLETEQPPTGQVIIRHAAVVTETRRMEHLTALKAMRREHVWSDEVVEERFYRWRDHSVYAMIVRVFELPSPVSLELKEEYTGCKSWVHLEEDISIEGARPVIDEAEFVARSSDIP